MLLGETEVDDFEFIVFVQHYVLRFDVSVDNTLGVHVADCSKKLFHVFLSNPLRQDLVILIFYFFEQFTAVDVLHRKIEISLVLVGFIVFYDIRVIKLGQRLHFLSDHLVLEVLSFKDFDCDLVGSIMNILSQVDLAE